MQSVKISTTKHRFPQFVVISLMFYILCVFTLRFTFHLFFLYLATNQTLYRKYETLIPPVPCSPILWIPQFPASSLCWMPAHRCQDTVQVPKFRSSMSCSEGEEERFSVLCLPCCHFDKVTRRKIRQNPVRHCLFFKHDKWTFNIQMVKPSREGSHSDALITSIACSLVKRPCKARLIHQDCVDLVSC